MYDLHRGGYARRLRLALAAEHLDRPFDPEVDASDEAHLLKVMADCVDPDGMFTAYQQAAASLDAWHVDGGRGPRPPGRLRRRTPPAHGPGAPAQAQGPDQAIHDPDGPPGPQRKRDAF